MWHWSDGGLEPNSALEDRIFLSFPGEAYPQRIWLYYSNCGGTVLPRITAVLRWGDLLEMDSQLSWQNPRLGKMVEPCKTMATGRTGARNTLFTICSINNLWTAI